jgi:cytochrome d ubiquinol oxidase subunit II
MDLVTVWFVALAVLWTGFFLLEGFDFGVGALTWRAGRDDAERRKMLRAIGPVWDADEVWLIAGGAALFAAFPLWFATAFSAAYVPLILVIAAIIVRGVAVEYRGRRPEHAWRERWDRGIGLSSLLLPFLFGVFWAGMVHGLPLDADGVLQGGSLLAFLHPYSILGGLALVAFSLAHGATFLALRTDGPVRERMARLGVRLDLVSAVTFGAFSAWTFVAYTDGDRGALAAGLAATAGIAAAAIALARGHGLLAFWLNAVSLVGFVAQLFLGLYPNAVPTSLADGASLTLAQAAAGPTSLRLITVVAAIALPIIIAYQAWSFWVFRARIGSASKEVDHE